jgi:serine/threonine-protein kinase
MKDILRSMQPGENNRQAVRDELERVLASGEFARSERVSRFLRFLVERQLAGRESELKESLIAVELFGRKPDYDPKQDSTVRTEAVRLRARLGQYYEGEGSRDPVVIELPKGGYTPRFRRREERAPRDQKKRSSAPLLIVVLAGLAVAIAVGAWWWVQHGRQPIAIAVLPLVNVSRDPANDYFADGLTDELIRNLSIIDGLVVRSRTSSFAFKGKPRHVREVGMQLAADYILEGSVLRAGQQLRINVQLVRARDDFPLWAGKFDQELRDVFAIQEEIARGIVNSLRLKLGRGRRRYETSVEAYDLYLQARAFPFERGIATALAPKRVDLFRRAIVKDASFAPGYAGLASEYATLSQMDPRDHADELAQMRAAAEQAIKLDPLLAEAHDALGMLYARDGHWQQSEKSFRRAIQLDPGNSMTYHHFAIFFLLAIGRIEEAVEQMRIAQKTDPLAVHVREALAWVLISAGRYDEAAKQCEKLPADTPLGQEFLGRARLGQGRIEEAIQILAAAERLRYLGYAYGRAGRRDEAERLAATVASEEGFSQALIFAGLGDKDRTLKALERMAPLGPVRIGRALNSPEFSLLRGDPRVKVLRKKVGLPE